MRQAVWLTVSPATFRSLSSTRAARSTRLAAPHKRLTMKEIEIPIKTPELKAALGVGTTMLSAIKSQMGVKNRHRVKLSEVRQWMSDHPDFRVMDVYHRSECGCLACRQRKRDTNYSPRGGGARSLARREPESVGAVV